jgi:Transposase IS116/IS110/IS902 family
VIERINGALSLPLGERRQPETLLNVISGTLSAPAKNLVSWVAACPGEEESAGVNRSKRSPKGNRQMRRILNQAANAAVKHIRDRLWWFRAASRTQQSDRSHCASPLSLDLDPFAQRRSL